MDTVGFEGRFPLLGSGPDGSMTGKDWLRFSGVAAATLGTIAALGWPGEDYTKVTRLGETGVTASAHFDDDFFDKDELTALEFVLPSDDRYSVRIDRNGEALGEWTFSGASNEPVFVTNDVFGEGVTRVDKIVIEITNQSDSDRASDRWEL